MAYVPVRPQHTGTARVESLKALAHSERNPRRPTHLRLPGAAVALERNHGGALPGARAIVRTATRPLLLADGRTALALRLVKQETQVLVRAASGHVQWLPLKRVMSLARANTWAQQGFGG